jgi:hypothetical protein
MDSVASWPKVACRNKTGQHAEIYTATALSQYVIKLF